MEIIRDPLRALDGGDPVSARYVVVEVADFEALMSECAFGEIPTRRQGEERQFQRVVAGTVDLAVRVYSSIVPGDGAARRVGKDAMRVVLVHVPTGKLVWSATRVHRTQNWRTTLRERMREAWRSGSNATRCPDCGAPMVERETKDGARRFLGCARYPDCRRTMPAPRGAAGG